MNSTVDILGLGAVAVDDLIYVGSYPPPDVKTRVLRRERQCGGLTATALVAASRLGSRCAYAGMLGEDELSRFVMETLEREGVDLAHLVFQADARPIHSTIVVGRNPQTRNIFPVFEGITGAHPELPGKEVIRSVRVLFADHIGMEGMIRAARIAREAKIPVVADLESHRSPFFSELFDLVDHLIIPLDFARQLTGEDDPSAALQSLRSGRRDTVAITCGEVGCWYLQDSHGEKPQHQPAFRVEVMDTTGCGDVFHGAYASALARGLEIGERVRFASAAAALKATRRGGQAGIPTLSVVEAFLANSLGI